jgi:single-stranded-DNA-specific exonuclease
MKPNLHRLWRQRIISGDSRKISPDDDLNVSTFLWQLLQQRGVKDATEVNSFLTGNLSSLPDPFLLSGMEQAVTRVVTAVQNREKIAIHGDYDVDGITGTTLLCEALRQFGAEVDYHIPLRLRDGYGLAATAIKQAAAAGVTLLVSVDCGICAINEAQLAAELGIDLLITDHHQPGKTLPIAVARINPWLQGCAYPDKHLSGVGVAFMLIIAVRSRLRELSMLSATQPDIRYLLDLVAMGTIADLVPLHGVNRLLVKSGLRLLEQSCRVGVHALKTVADVKQMSTGAVGFKMAPRLNAAGRLEDAALGVQLLLSTDAAEAHSVAIQLNGFNRQRQNIEKQVLEQALERVKVELRDEDHTIVLADCRWHSGVIGIVASRLVEMFHRPTVLIALDAELGKGSARSIAGFHMYNAFDNCAATLLGFGGHEFAAGLTISAENIADFSDQFEHYARTHLKASDLLPLRYFDSEVLLQDLDRRLLNEINSLAPFGAGNPEPVLMCKSVHARQIAVVGEQHLRFTVHQGGYSLPCIAFGVAGRLAELDGYVDILFNLTLNRWRERENLQLQVKDFRASKG